MKRGVKNDVKKGVNNDVKQRGVKNDVKRRDEGRKKRRERTGLTPRSLTPFFTPFFTNSFTPFFTHFFTLEKANRLASATRSNELPQCLFDPRIIKLAERLNCATTV